MIPFFNEEGNVLPLLQELADVLPRLGGHCEVIAVDDGSTDATPARLRRALALYPWLRVLGFDQNYGVSSALDAGYRAARGALIGSIDGDGQLDPKDFLALKEALAHADAAVGYRTERHDPFTRKLTSFLGNTATRLRSGESFRDVTGPIRLFKKEALSALPRLDGFHRFVPILMKRAGFRVVEVPVSHRPRTSGRAKFGFWNRVFKVLPDLMRLPGGKGRALDYRVVLEFSSEDAPQI